MQKAIQLNSASYIFYIWSCYILSIINKCKHRILSLGWRIMMITFTFNLIQCFVIISFLFVIVTVFKCINSSMSTNVDTILSMLSNICNYMHDWIVHFITQRTFSATYSSLYYHQMQRTLQCPSVGWRIMRQPNRRQDPDSFAE